MAFVSSRERRLWVTTLLLLLIIYATLGVARDWFRLLEDNGWGTDVFLSVSCFILVFIVTHGMMVFPKWREILVALGIVAVYALIFMKIDVLEGRIHVIMYGVIALMIYAALLERTTHGHPVPASFLIAIAATAGLGTMDEFIQLTLPSRVFDTMDILYNCLASVMAVMTNASLRWARRKSN